MPNARDGVFLKACRRERTPYTPVWFMRQAGRYMKEYRALRDEHSFLELCKNAPLAADITVHAQQTLDTDAAILFSDILLILEPMGMKLDYVKGDGPSVAWPDGRPDVDRLAAVDASVSLAFVPETIRLARSRLAPEVALIGFAGAPFTLASYMIEGGSSKSFTRTLTFMREDKARWDVLMRKTVTSVAGYLAAQVKAGADALQLFDSWAGALSGEEYRTYALPYTRSLIESLRGTVPLIHFGTRTAPFLETFAEAGGEVIGVDHRIGLDEAWKRIGPRALQGNLDPALLVEGGAAMEREARKVLSGAAARPGHIFNLGHGILPETPVEHVKILVRKVREWSRQ